MATFSENDIIGPKPNALLPYIVTRTGGPGLITRDSRYLVVAAPKKGSRYTRVWDASANIHELGIMDLVSCEVFGTDWPEAFVFLGHYTKPPFLIVYWRRLCSYMKHYLGAGF